MTKLTSMSTIKPVKPVSLLTIEIVREIQITGKAIGVELLLVGAQAKVILLENIHGLNPGRATGDIDVAFGVESWEQFNKIKQSLIATGYFRELPKSTQRLLFKSNMIESEYIVDIIPFGEVQDAQNMIAWPPDMDIFMSVSGYKEAQQSAIEVEIDTNLIIKVVSLPGLTILKIFAWSDRGTTTKNKDALDLLTLLRTYHEAGNTDRIYEVPTPDILQSLNYDPELMGAWLLGNDSATIINETTLAKIQELIELKEENLVIHMAKSLLGVDNPLYITEQLLISFKLGFKKA